MEGNKEDQQHSLSNGEFHQQAQPQEEQLGLGLQKQAPSNPIVPDPDPIDRENELNQKLGELSVKDEEEIGSVVLSPEVVEERKLKEAVAGEKVEKVEVEEALVGEAVPVEVEVQSDVKAIEEEIAGDGAVGDEFRDVDLSGLGDANDRGEKDEENDHIGDGKANEEMESETCPVLGEDETDNKELKEADNKELKEGIADNHGSEWGEIENDEWDDGTEKKQAEDKLETVNNYESNWIETENGEDDARKIEDTKEQLIFENYEDERSGEDQYNEEANEYGNVEGESGWKDERNRRFHYPLRPDAEDCAYYMKTGTCKFGSNCKFNHPLRRRNQTSKETFKQKEENQDKLEQTECKEPRIGSNYHLFLMIHRHLSISLTRYYSTSVGCKYGKACRFNHGRGKAAVAPILEFNFLGLPIRAGEKECPYYMRTGSCKYGSNCRFNHPDPTAVGGGDPFSGHSDSSSQGGLKDTNSGWSSARLLNETAPFMPVMYPPTPAAPPETEWNGYKAPVYPTTESGLPTPPAFAMNIPATDANFYAHHQQRMLIDEFPERPGQPECSYYMKTGNCKYKSGCKFHHPKNRKAKMSSSVFSDQGLPLRPDQNICTHYSRFGICKYGPACKYNHPAMNGNLSSAVGSEPGQPFQYGNSVDAGEEWKRESFMQQSV